MGDAADDVTDAGFRALALHQTGDCGDLGPCQYCEDEPAPVTRARRPGRPAAAKQARTFSLRAEEGSAPVARIGTQEYGWKFLGPLSGYDLTKPDGTIYQVRRVERDGVYLWVCSTQAGELCPAWEYSPRPKTCKHCKLGLHLGLIQ